MPRAQKPTGTSGRALDGVRKIIEIDGETWRALQGLASDRASSVQELADEAFRDLLRKHHRPTTLREALRASTRVLPANDTTSGREGPRRKV